MGIARSSVRPLSVFALVILQATTGLGARSPNPRPQAPPADGRQISNVDIRSRVSAAEARYGPDSPEFSSVLDGLVSDLLNESMGNSDEAVTLGERAVQLKQRLHPDLVDPENATPVENLGKLRSLRGEYKLAIPSLEQACSLREKAGTGTTELADCQESLALALIRVSRFGEAEVALNRAREVRNASAQSHPEALSRTLGLLAQLHRWAGRYDTARALLDQALALHQTADTSDEDLVTLQLLKGDLLWLGGDIAQARDTYASAAGASPDLVTRGCIDCLVAMRRLAYAEDALGNSSRAVSLAEEAREIGAVHLGPCHDERASILNDLAVIRENLGDYGASKALFEQSLAEKTRCSAANGADTITPVLNLARVAKNIGNLPEAERRYREVLRSWSERYGPTHPFVALVTESLADIALRRGNASQARSQWLQVLDMRRRSLGPDHPEVAWTLTNLGETAASAGDTAAATRYLDQSLEIYRRIGVTDYPDRFALLLSARGHLQLRLGSPESARDSFSEAFASRQRVLGGSHPITAEARLNLALAQALSGQRDLALAGALAAEQAGRTHLRNTISYLPESQALGYAAVRTRGLDLAVSIASSDSLSTVETFDAVVRSRAVVLDELAVRGSIRSGDSHLEELHSAFTLARQRMANLSLRSLRDRQPTPVAILDAARQQVDDAEQTLAERSAAFRRERRLAEAGLDEVRRGMPDGSALVSFLRYDQSLLPRKDAAAAGGTKPSTASYAAFVITSSDQSVAIVPLGAAASLDALVVRWHRAASRELPTTEGEYRTIAASLRRRLWDPIADHLGSASRLLIVPDGAINLVSFGALPVDGGYLQERYAGIHYMSAERDLLARGETRASEGLLAVGGPDFDGRSQGRPSASSAPPPARSQNDRSITRSGCDDFSSLRFGALPGTRSEVEDIGELWRSASNRDATATILIGGAASEDAVKRGVVGRRIVHLATHGFFLDGRCQSGLNDTRAVGGLAPATPARAARPQVALESPLLLSGLALAGANGRVPARRKDDEDGILTAEEVASLDLDGVEWAVLSACDTGLGAIKAGEGVFGLRRAFQIAGARTVIMSLWAVEDQATRQWMRALYEARLQQKLDTLESVHAASLSVLRDRRTKGLSTHPFYWAAFVAAGDWR